jgi:sodium/potassium/calcium exchanger 6
MAVVACFAGPVFNLLIGLASSIAFLTTILGDLPFNVKQGEIVLAVGCLFSVMFTISQLRHRSPREFEIPRSFANAAFATYGAFLLIYLLCEARLLFVSKLAS